MALKCSFFQTPSNYLMKITPLSLSSRTGSRTSGCTEHRSPLSALIAGAFHDLTASLAFVSTVHHHRPREPSPDSTHVHTAPLFRLSRWYQLPYPSHPVTTFSPSGASTSPLKTKGHQYSTWLRQGAHCSTTSQASLTEGAENAQTRPDSSPTRHGYLRWTFRLDQTN